MRERVLALLLRDQLRERRAVGDALFAELVGERDRLPVLVQRHQHRHVFLRSADAQLHAVHEPIENVCGIELAVDELVAHGRPRRFLRRHDLHAMLRIEALDRRHHHRGAVGQRNEADPDFGFFRRVAARGPRRVAGTGTEGRRQCGASRGLEHASPPWIDRGCVAHRFAAPNKKRRPVRALGVRAHHRSAPLPMRSYRPRCTARASSDRH